MRNKQKFFINTQPLYHVLNYMCTVACSRTLCTSALEIHQFTCYHLLAIYEIENA